jgi:hypothetical protein
MTLAALSPHLEHIVGGLDIPDDIAEEAVLSYEAVGAWLADETSPLHGLTPEIYPQGSFRLGTPVVPLTGDDFDIDLVCRISLRKEQTTQEALKNSVGSRLRQNVELNGRLTERRRCWTLNYGRRFHLDVLPCIPNAEGVPTSILLTDRELIRWQFSNPKGYAEWFYQRMGAAFTEARQRIAAAAYADVEEVPEWRVRTPLQRVVQLLKRQRDVAFAQNSQGCPASIIVTTLAAQAYGSEWGLAEALSNVVGRIPTLIENRNGRWWVANPADNQENFADKWNETPALRTHFLRWIEQLGRDIDAAAQSPNPAPLLERMFRPTAVAAPLQVNVPALGGITHVQAPPWHLSVTKTCTLRATVYSKVKGRKLWPLTDRPVQKGVGLRFEASTNAKAPYVVKWQVTNTGLEAARVPQGLRGGFDDGEGTTGSVRWESTAYAGTHWVEAFVIQNGACVARSGRKYVRIKG